MKSIIFIFTAVIFSFSSVAEEKKEKTEKITLKEAMENAYKTNQSLGQAEYELKTSHENLSAARREWLPQTRAALSGSVGFNEKETKNQRFARNDGKYHSQRNTGKAEVSLSQNIFNGGGTLASIQKTKKDVDARTAKYQGTESKLFLDTVKVYSEYVKKKAVHNLTKTNQIVLEESLAVVQSQYELGEKTVSDVASTQADLEEAKARVTQAKAELASSISTFESIVGFLPNDNIESPQSYSDIPTSLEEAQEIAFKYNYDLLISDAVSEAAKAEAKEAFKSFLPSLDLEATGSRTLGGYWDKESYNNGFGKTRTNDAEIKATLSIPLDFRGAIQSGIRGKKYAAAQKRMEALYKRREVKNSVTSTWEKYKAAFAKIKQYKAQVKATKIAFDSTNEEFNVGSKTTLEVLTAENKYFQAQINLINARQDYVQNSYELAHVVGLLNPTALNLNVEKFNPVKHKETRPVWGFGIGKDRRGYDLDTKDNR